MARFKPGKKRRKAKSLSNKGLSTPPDGNDTSNTNTNTNTNTIHTHKGIRRYTAYRDNDNRYYITIPLIDKIALCGGPLDLSEQEISDLNTMLYFEAKIKEEGNGPDIPVEVMKFKKSDKNSWIKSYRYQYKITPPGSKDFMTLFFAPSNPNTKQRFLRVEFNPRRMGQKNIEYLINWYNRTIPGCTFNELLTTPESISYVDVALDIVGIDISDLILDRKARGDSMRWYSQDGMLETYYFNAKPGKSSSMKIYDKYKAEDDKSLLYGEDIPVTRVEVRVNTKLSVKDLCDLNNKFNKLKIEILNEKFPDLIKYTRRGRDHLELFLDSVRCRGESDAVKRLPDELKASYSTIVRHGLLNIIEPYNDSAFWARQWAKGLKLSGILSDA